MLKFWVAIAVVLTAAGAGGQAMGQTAPAAPSPRVLPQSREQVQLSFAPVVRRAAPAVVNVFSKRVVRTQNPFANDPFFRQFFGENGPFGVPQEQVQNSLGSGVIVAADGLIVTNHHVIKDMTEIRVVLADRREFEATLVRSDD